MLSIENTPQPKALAAPLGAPLGALRAVSLAQVRDPECRDLTQRQLAVLLTVYLTDGPHTVRGLAAEMNVAKPVVTRVLDRLGELDFARREIDPTDRRSVLVQLTTRGQAFVRGLGAVLRDAMAEA